jgi:hypothetical protein
MYSTSRVSIVGRTGTIGGLSASLAPFLLLEASSASAACMAFI